MRAFHSGTNALAGEPDNATFRQDGTQASSRCLSPIEMPYFGTVHRPRKMSNLGAGMYNCDY